MAIVVESTSINTASASSTLVITKPTGLAVGNLMIAVLNLYDASDTISTLSGWTLVNAGVDNDNEINVQYKIADAGDVAASNFTFSASGSATYFTGGILRVSGHSTLSTIQGFDFETASSTATPTFTSSITPLGNGALAILAFANYGNNIPPTFSSYTATGGGISFTELLDASIDSGTQDPGHAIAYGIQSTATEITAYGVTASLSKVTWAGTLVVVNPRIDATATNATFAVSPALFAPTMSNTNVVSNAAFEVSPTINTQNASGTTPTQWTNETKPSTSWTNTPKI